VNQNQAIVEILTYARDYVAAGWVQHRGRDHQGRVCAGQAINNAARRFIVGIHTMSDDTIYWAQIEAARMLLDVANQTTPEPEGTRYTTVPSWNDALGRTKAQVLAAFEQAIRIARAEVSEANTPAELSFTDKRADPVNYLPPIKDKSFADKAKILIGV